MKKFILLFIPFLLTGCFSSSLNGDLTTTCVKDEYSASITENKKYTLYFKKGDIYKIIYEDSFISNEKIDMSNAIKSYQKAYGNENGIVVKTSDNSITYEFSINDISDTIKKEFNINKDYNKQVKLLKESGFVCK